MRGDHLPDDETAHQKGNVAIRVPMPREEGLCTQACIAQGRRPGVSPFRIVSPMTASRTQKWIELLVSNQTYVLARSQSLDDLKEDIESAVSSGGKFVDFTVSGDENVSLLVTAASHVVLVPQSRERGIRDTEVLDNPRGWSADY